MQKIPNLSVFYKENVPEDYHYRQSDRIGLFKIRFFLNKSNINYCTKYKGPIVAVADPGYLLYDTNITYTSNGNHGYNK
jgi:hypothetical protein